MTGFDFFRLTNNHQPDRLKPYLHFLANREESAEKINGEFARIIGKSEKGMPILGFVFGNGPVTISLVAGAHADEPVGPNTLYHVIAEMERSPEPFRPLFSKFRFLIIPHVNPDGDQVNSNWFTGSADFGSLVSGMVREPPGRDIEFGYPGMRPENRAASSFWKQEGPADLHFSLHGMPYSEGFLLLINDEWEEKTRSWRENFARVMWTEGLFPHDHNRGGEKGFNYMGPGFTSTPKGSAMRDFFLNKGDPDTAAQFHDSSMEFHTKQNPAVLCMVTEFPLFAIAHSGQSGRPENYLRLREKWTGLRADLTKEGTLPESVIKQLQREFDIRPVGVKNAIRLQRYAISSAMDEMERQQIREDH